MFNKKSQIEDWIPIILIVIIIIFIVIIIPVTNLTSNERKINRLSFQPLKIDSDQLLVNYLRIPVEIENFPNAEMADAINYYFSTLDEDLFDKIKTETSKFISKSSLESDTSSWSIIIENLKTRKTIRIDSEKVLELESEGYIKTASIKIRQEVSKTILPSPVKDELIQIQLFKVTISLS